MSRFKCTKYCTDLLYNHNYVKYRVDTCLCNIVDVITLFLS